MNMYGRIPGRMKGDEEVLQGGVAVKKVSPAEIEAELAKYGRKLQPVTRKINRIRRPDRNTIFFGSDYQ